MRGVALQSGRLQRLDHGFAGNHHGFWLGVTVGDDFAAELFRLFRFCAREALPGDADV